MFIYFIMIENKTPLMVEEPWRIVRRMRIKDIHENIGESGLFIPLSVALGQNGSNDHAPYPQDIYRIVHTLLDCTRDVRLISHGSVPQTALQQFANQIERRGTITNAFTRLLNEDIGNLRKMEFSSETESNAIEQQKKVQQMMWKVMSYDMPYGPDLDFSIQGSNEATFDANIQSVLSNIRRLGSRIDFSEEHINHGSQYTEHYALPFYFGVANGRNSLSHKKPGKINPQGIILTVQRNEIDNRGIQFLNVDIHTLPSQEIAEIRAHRKADIAERLKQSQRIGSLFFSMANTEPATPNYYLRDYRKDKRYGLSWDTEVTGTVTQLISEG